MRKKSPLIRTSKPFYGWWIVLSTIAFHGLSGAAFGFTFGQYLLQIERQFGWSKFAISSAFSVSQLAAGILSPIHGWLLDKFSPKIVTQVGIILFGGGFLILPLANNFASFFAIIFIMSIGTNLAGWLTLTTVITRWFQKSRALALGLSSTGIGLAGVLSPIIAWSLVTHGWRPTAFGTGVAVLIIGLPLAHLLRGFPEDHGMKPDGILLSEDLSTDNISNEEFDSDFLVSEALKDKSFWYISLGHGIALISVFIMLVHFVPFLVQNHGWQETSAQAMLTVVTVTSIIGQIGGGFLGDRFSKTRIAGLCMLGHGIAMLTLAFASSGVVIAIAALLHGLSWGTRGPLMMAMRADFYGRKHFGKIAGYSNIMVMFGPLIGPIFAGAISDQYGDYKIAFLTTGVVIGISSVFFFLAKKPIKPAQNFKLPSSY